MKVLQKIADKTHQGYAIKAKRLVNFSNTKHFSILGYAKDFYQEIKQEQNQSNIAKPLNPNTKSFL